MITANSTPLRITLTLCLAAVPTMLLALGSAVAAPATSDPSGPVRRPSLSPELSGEWRTGEFRGRMLPYRVVGGLALFEGDIVLGPASELETALTPPDAIAPMSIGVAHNGFLWPKTGTAYRVPFTITYGNDAIPTAIDQFNATFAGLIQWVPRAGEADYVDFNLDPNDFSGGGYSAVGRVGGKQTLGGSIEQSVPTLLHEMGHAIGLWHEQSRSDRDAYLTVQTVNLIKREKLNFDTLLDNAENLGLFDYRSVMMYHPYVFTKNGAPTLETIPSGIPLTNTEGYSVGDIDGVKRLYNAAPTLVTVTSNPPGLQVIVDGVTITTPQTFNFALNSTHTLSVASAPQALGQLAYTFGRWNDSMNRTHTINVLPGNGLRGSPATSPATTVYSAEFRELLPFSPWIYPPGSGSLSANPAPKSYPPLAGQYHIRRQAVTLQATPAPGYSHYRTYTGYDRATSVNPKSTTDFWPQYAYFTPDPIVRFSTNPTGLGVWIDVLDNRGLLHWYGPVNQSRFYPADGNWSPGSVHAIDILDSPYSPYTWTIRYPWLNWSDGGARARTITVPSGNRTITANYGAAQMYVETRATGGAYWYCGGGVTVTPASGDGFYTKGSSVTVSQTAWPGWVFTGWKGDLTGAGNPRTIAVNDEQLILADYNTIAAPLGIMGFNPVSAVVGSSGFTLTITGSGFTGNSIVYVNGTLRSGVTYVNATTLRVPVTSADVAQTGAFQVRVENFPPGSSCSAAALKSFFVRSTSAQPLAATTPSALTFAPRAVGTTSAAQTVTLSNNGNRGMGLYNVSVVGTHATNFIRTTTCGTSLAAGASCTINVSFKPSAAGNRSAQLILVSSAFDSPRTLPLAGTGQ
ncbi:M12 family metallopeptidase [Methylolobus aquaticus]